MSLRRAVLCFALVIGAFASPARADFLERIRRYSFLVVLGVVLTACYYVHTDNIDIHVGGYRGTMNSAWMGAVMTLIVTTLLGMSGFYLVNNCVSRDEQTGVGQILAATPVSKLQYVCGKALSNFAVLSLIVFVLMLAAVPLKCTSVRLGETESTWRPSEVSQPEMAARSSSDSPKRSPTSAGVSHL